MPLTVFISGELVSLPISPSNILLKNNEEEEYPIDDNLDFNSSSHRLLSSTEEE